jgi:hypothetical protein
MLNLKIKIKCIKIILTKKNTSKINQEGIDDREVFRIMHRFLALNKKIRK